MEYLATALCILLSGCVSITAFWFLDRHCLSTELAEGKILPDSAEKKEQLSLGSDRILEERNAAAGTPSSGFPEINAKRWVQLALCGVLVGLVCFLRLHRSADWRQVAETVVCALVLSAAGIIDGNIKKIPNKLVLIFLAAGTVLLIVKCIAVPANIKSLLLKSLVGAVGSLLLFLLFTVLTKGGFGMGDTKLTAALGLTLGLMDTMVTVLLGMIICMFVSIVLLLLGKKTLKDDMPFGPYIFLGYILIVALEHFL